MNRRLSVLKQWSRERFSSKARTEPSDDFVELEDELRVQYDGAQALHRSMAAYVKWLCKRHSDGNKNQQLALARVGADMHNHGSHLGEDSDYGQCLMSVARSNDRLARAQEAFAANVNDCWLESLERSLEHMKLCQDARRAMESQRLAYDAARVRLRKTKREDSGLTEEVNNLRQIYEESHDNVMAHMLEIRDAETDTVADLAGFLEAQLAYHNRCVEILKRTKSDWPIDMPDDMDADSIGTSVQPRYRRAQSLGSTATFLHSTVGGTTILTDDATLESGSDQGTLSSSS